MDDEYVGVIAPIGVLNVHSASRQPHSAVRLALGALAGVVLAALLLLISTTTLHFGSSGFSSFVEDWVYDFVTHDGRPGDARPRGRAQGGAADLGAPRLRPAELGRRRPLLRSVGTANPPFPSIGDVLYIAGYVPILAGIVSYVRARVGRMTAIVWTDVRWARSASPRSAPAC